MPLRKPIFFQPLWMERVWGGNRLGRLFGAELPAGKTIGESWELSDRPHEQTRVIRGAFAGQTLHELLEQHGEAILGKTLWARHPARFPLLIKYVDAGQKLSVQVHPDDAGARAFDDRGKAECWVVVHTEPGATLVRGFKPGVTRADVERALQHDGIEELLHVYTPRVGDVIALPPGLVHAIGAGLVVAEIQQNSDVTLRLYDYKRLGLDGQPRPLHIPQALAALRFTDRGTEFRGDLSRDTMPPRSIVGFDGGRVEKLLEGTFFDLERITLEPGATYTRTASGVCSVMMALSGNGIAGHEPFHAGQTALLPAAAARTEFTAGGHGATLLFSRPTPDAC